MARDEMLIVDSADKMPPPTPGRHPLTPISGADFERKPSRRLTPQVWLILTIIVLAPVLWLLWRLDSALQDFFARYPFARDGLLWLLIASVAFGLVMALLTLAARAWLSVQHARVLRSRHGVPLDVVQQLQLHPWQLEQQAIDLELARAPYLQFPNLSTQSVSHILPKAQDTGSPALPEPSVRAVSDSRWRSWLLEAPHLLISGPSGSGKTTLAKAILGDTSANADLLILDPHDAAGKWPLPAIGGGRDYAAIYVRISDLLNEMDRRFKQLQQGASHFTPITVLIDEAPAVALYDQKQWTFLASRLTSEARKIGIRLLILGQSHLVRDLGLSSLVRRNLGLVGLGAQALDLVTEERDSRRRSQLLDLVRGNTYVAAYSYRAQIEVLDVINVPQIAAKPLTAHVWKPSIWNEGDGPDRAIPDSLRTDGRADGGQKEADRLRETLIVSWKRSGRNREQIRQELQSLGMEMSNEVYRQILAQHGLG